MGKKIKKTFEDAFDECIATFEKLQNLPIGAKAVVMILKHYKDKYKEEK